MKPDTKQPLTAEQAEWFAKASIQKPEWINPMVLKFGIDPEGRKCKGCDFLTVNACSKRYYKCRLRGVTSGPERITGSIGQLAQSGRLTSRGIDS